MRPITSPGTMLLTMGFCVSISIAAEAVSENPWGAESFLVFKSKA